MYGAAFRLKLLAMNLPTQCSAGLLLSFHSLIPGKRSNTIQFFVKKIFSASLSGVFVISFVSFFLDSLP